MVRTHFRHYTLQNYFSEWKLILTFKHLHGKLLNSKVNLMKKYDFKEQQFWKKISRFAKNAGAKVIYSALLMYYAFRRNETPKWAKVAILGSITYFLSPVDFIPDLTPILGFTDDMAVLVSGLITVSSYIDDSVRMKAKGKLSQWFKEEDIADAIADIELRMKKK